VKALARVEHVALGAKQKSPELQAFAPMNLPGEESIRTKIPVRVHKIEDGRVKI
jgi:hypothetical protein